MFVHVLIQKLLLQSENCYCTSNVSLAGPDPHGREGLVQLQLAISS